MVTGTSLDCMIKIRNSQRADVWLANRTQTTLNAGTAIEISADSGKRLTIVLGQQMGPNTGWAGQNLSISGRTCTARSVLTMAQ